MKLHKYISLLLAVLLLLSLTGCKEKDEKKPSETKNSVATQNQTPSQGNEIPEQTQNQVVQQGTQATTGNDATENIAPTETVSLCEHQPSEYWVVEKTSTCTTEGLRHRICILCQTPIETETIPKQEHDKSTWVVEKIATCTAEGRQSQSCKQCKTKLITANMAKVAHKPDSTGTKCTVCKGAIENTAG